jgi:hypothetical protein
MWKKLVSKHANIFLVMAGHIPREKRLSSRGEKGNTVHQLLANYQTQHDGGDAKMRLLKFIPAEGKIEVSTYSPHLKKEYEGKASRFSMTQTL